MITCFLCKVHATILSAITGVNWEWKSFVQGFLGVSGAPSGSIMELDLGCALSFDFPAKVYFSLTFPIAAILIVLLVAVILSKTTVRFEGCKATMWLFTIIWVYTFGASILSDLFVLFPCFDGVDGDGADKEMMLHDPDMFCYGHPVLMVLTPIGIAGYSFAAIYVLGIAFWGHKETIQHRGAATKHELEYTFKTFGFLFYGTVTQITTNNSVTRCACIVA